MPRVVVLMPAKDSADTVHSAIATTLCALPRDASVAVWDDGSTDDTGEVVSRIRDKRVRLISSPISVGSGVARQRLLDETDSEYVACMDADDLCAPWRFRRQAAAAEAYDIVFAAAVKFSSVPPYFKPMSSRKYGTQDIRTALLFHCPFIHSTMFASRSSISSVGGYRDLKRAQDYDLWLRCAEAGLKMTRIAIPSVGYRLSSSQISGSRDYAGRVWSDQALLSSYCDLLIQIFGASVVSEFMSARDGSEHSRTRVLALLAAQVNQMSTPQLRSKYMNYLRRGQVTML